MVWLIIEALDFDREGCVSQSVVSPREVEVLLNGLKRTYRRGCSNR